MVNSNPNRQSGPFSQIGSHIWNMGALQYKAFMVSTGISEFRKISTIVKRAVSHVFRIYSISNFYKFLTLFVYKSVNISFPVSFLCCGQINRYIHFSAFQFCVNEMYNFTRARVMRGGKGIPNAIQKVQIIPRTRKFNHFQKRTITCNKVHLHTISCDLYVFVQSCMLYIFVSWSK